jgi:hypothetical protein
MHKSIALGSIFALGLTGQAMADDFSYTYVEAGYFNAGDSDFDGFDLKGSYGFTDLVHGFAGYSDGKTDGGFDVEGYEIGLGLSHSLTSNLDAIGTVSYLDADYSGGSDDGYKLGARLRGRVGAGFEVEAGLNYVDFSDAGDDTSFDVGGRYHLTSAFALGAGVEFNDDDEMWRVNVRYNFAR